MDSPVSPKEEIWFLLVCHHISNAVYTFYWTDGKCDWTRRCCVRMTVGSSAWGYSRNVKYPATRTKASCTGKSEGDAPAPLFVARIQCPHCIMTYFIVYILSLVKCYIWSTALYGAETWTLRAVDQKHLESFEVWCCRRMEKISWIDHVKVEEVLLWIKEQRNILHGKCK